MKKEKPWRLEFTNNEFSNELLDRFIFAVQGRMENLYVTEKPLTAEQAAKYLGISKRSLSNLVSSGQVKQYFFKTLDIPFYLPSQMYARLKGEI